jgi:hypothetical protein
MHKILSKIWLFLALFSLALSAQNIEKEKNIDEVVISNRSDPKALEILKKYRENYQQNHPNQLQSYGFKSYSKVSVDVNKDSLAALKTRLLGLKKDSLWRKINNSAFFLWEKADQHWYHQSFGQKTITLDNRMSGLKEPIYEILHSFSALSKKLSLLEKSNEKNYKFYLSDSLQYEGRKTYHVLIKERKGKNKEIKLVSAYFDAQNYALVKYHFQSQKNLRYYIWAPVYGQYFLKEEMIHQEKERDKKAKPEDFGRVLRLHKRYFDFEEAKHLQASQFEAYRYSIANSDGKQLYKYRLDSLTQREKQTYPSVDSLVNKMFTKANGLPSVMNLDNALQLLRGKIRLGKIDLDLVKHFNFNLHEGFRSCLPFKTNELFSTRWSADAYVAYGQRDQKIKYGLGLDYKLPTELQSFFRLSYANDVVAMGRNNTELWDNQRQWQNLSRDLNSRYFLGYQQWQLAYQTDLSNALTMRFSFNYRVEKPLFDDPFQGQQPWHNPHLRFGLKYSPGHDYILTKAGKQLINRGNHEYYLNAEQSPEWMGGRQHYTRIDALGLHQFANAWGQFKAHWQAGISLGQSDLSKHFEAGGLAGEPGLNFAQSRLSVHNELGFATMPAGNYYNSHFVSFGLKQDLPWRIKFYGSRYHQFNLQYKAHWGELRQPMPYPFAIGDTRKVYQEIGINHSNLFSTFVDVGMYYRVGAYSSPKVMENFGLQLLFNFNFPKI